MLRERKKLYTELALAIAREKDEMKKIIAEKIENK